MASKNKLFKILMTIFVFGFVIWLGGTIFRSTLAYSLFAVSDDIHLRPDYTNMERMVTINNYSMMSLTTDIAYSIAVISCIILAVMSHRDFKRRGWLFMVFCLFLITIPIQSYFIYADWKLAEAVYYKGVTDFYNVAVQKYFVGRITNVVNTSLQTIMLLAAFTCILYAVWRPLEKKNEE